MRNRCRMREALRMRSPEHPAADPPPLRVHVDGDELDLDLLREDVWLPYAIRLLDLRTQFPQGKCFRETPASNSKNASRRLPKPCKRSLWSCCAPLTRSQTANDSATSLHRILDLRLRSSRFSPNASLPVLKSFRHLEALRPIHELVPAVRPATWRPEGRKTAPHTLTRWWPSQVHEFETRSSDQESRSLVSP